MWSYAYKVDVPIQEVHEDIKEACKEPCEAWVVHGPGLPNWRGVKLYHRVYGRVWYYNMVRLGLSRRSYIHWRDPGREGQIKDDVVEFEELDLQFYLWQY